MKEAIDGRGDDGGSLIDSLVSGISNLFGGGKKKKKKGGGKYIGGGSSVGSL